MIELQKKLWEFLGISATTRTIQTLKIIITTITVSLFFVGIKVVAVPKKLVKVYFKT